MQKFTRFTSKAVPLNRANVDTDQIIPKQFLLAVDRKGFGHHLFHDHRWLDAEETKPNPDFVLNFPVYKGAGILVAQANFGNGSSREHAPWALLEYGFRCVIAPSFADIFKNNALGNGLLPVELKQSEIDQLFQVLEANPGMEITVDLEKQTVDAGSLHFTFTVDPFRRCQGQGPDQGKRVAAYARSGGPLFTQGGGQEVCQFVSPEAEPGPDIQSLQGRHPPEYCGRTPELEKDPDMAGDAEVFRGHPRLSGV